MTRWESGSAEVEALLAVGDLELVAAFADNADRSLPEADGHLRSAQLLGRDDPAGAYEERASIPSSCSPTRWVLQSQVLALPFSPWTEAVLSAPELAQGLRRGGRAGEARRASSTFARRRLGSGITRDSHGYQGSSGGARRELTGPPDACQCSRWLSCA